MARALLAETMLKVKKVKHQDFVGKTNFFHLALMHF
jgi:hypothetical protein